MLIAAMPTSLKGPGDKRAPKNLPGATEEVAEILSLDRFQTSITVLMYPSADQVLEVLKTAASHTSHATEHRTTQTLLTVV